MNTKTNTIKQSIQKASFLDKEEKKEWLTFIDNVQPKELERIEHFFKKANKADDLYKHKLLHKHKLGKQYVKKLQTISDTFTRQALEKQEKQN